MTCDVAVAGATTGMPLQRGSCYHLRKAAFYVSEGIRSLRAPRLDGLGLFVIRGRVSVVPNFNGSL